MMILVLISNNRVKNNALLSKVKETWQSAKSTLGSDCRAQSFDSFSNVELNNNLKTFRSLSYHSKYKDILKTSSKVKIQLKINQTKKLACLFKNVALQ